MNNKHKIVGIRTPTIIDYHSRMLQDAPQGTYAVSIILFLYDGSPLLEVVDGEFRGRVFIGSKMFAYNEPQTLH